MASLYIVATPIGNLADASSRSLEVLRSVDCILAEDTRVTLKLLNHSDIQGKRLISFPEQASDTKIEKIISEMKNGCDYALVSDAGTPAVADPGAKLVDFCLKEGFAVIPIPGPSAVTTLMSVMGQRSPIFHFWGFFPIKRKKQKELLGFMESVPGVHVFFESPYRILKTLRGVFEEKQDFEVVVGREMTKKHETFYRGTPISVSDQIEADVVKGEFCVGVCRVG